MDKKTKIEIEFELFSLSFNSRPSLWWISFCHFTTHEHSFALFHFEYGKGRFLFDFLYLSLLWDWYIWWQETRSGKS